MRIAFIADGRSEHTRRWLRYFVYRGDEVLLLSTHPYPGDLFGIHPTNLPKLFRAGASMVKSSDLGPSNGNVLSPQVALARTGLYKWVWPLWHQASVLEVPIQAFAARRVLSRVKPDVVHAMRMQNEGYVGALIGYHPLVLSAWGSDFAFMAQRYPIHGLLTRHAMRKLDAFTADCNRDLHLALSYGLGQDKPTRYFPGNGGVDLDVFCPGEPHAHTRDRLVVYSRGASLFYRTDTLLAAIKIMLANQSHKQTKFVLLASQAGVSMIGRMRKILGLPETQVIIQPFMSQGDLAHLLQKAAVSVSPSISDGIPNSMLEAMACGAFPVMSNLESIREWITHGVNGLLFDPTDAQDLADCLMEALDNPSMRQRARPGNSEMVSDRADYAKVMPQVRTFYQSVAENPLNRSFGIGR